MAMQKGAKSGRIPFWADKEAEFRTIYDNHITSLSAFCGFYIKDVSKRDDIIAETFYQLFHSLDGSADHVAITTYLFSKAGELCQAEDLEGESVQCPEKPPEEYLEEYPFSFSPVELQAILPVLRLFPPRFCPATG